MNTRRTVVLLETVHGSHLYGLNHANSDLDTYRVVANDPENARFLKLKTKQKINGEDDSLEISLTAFLLKCDEGVPQALETMFSSLSTGPLTSFTRRYYLNTPAFANTYRRTILNFARLGVVDAEAQELLAPKSDEELKKKRVRESIRVKKPRRVKRHGLLKYKRHALRLMLNRETGLEYGRFNPTLNEREKIFVLENGDLPDLTYAKLVKERVG